MREQLLHGRRQFLKKAAAGMIGTGLFSRREKSLAAHEELPQTQETIREFRVLGRTGFRVSDLAAGSIMDEGLLAAALDAGMNYIDSAEQYPGHHRIVGNVLKDRDRKSLFLSTKIEIREKDDKTKEGFLKRARTCLEELDTEYIDCMMMHMPEKIETLGTAGFHQAMDQLKSEGRLKYVGVSNHGSFWFRDPEETMDKVLTAAADDGRFDVFLFAYNFLKMDQGERVLQVCREKKIGTVLMKTTPVAIYYSLKSTVEKMQAEGKKVHPLYASGLERYQKKLERASAFIERYGLQNPDKIKSAAIQFVLGHPDVHTVCCLPRTHDELGAFLRLSGTRLNEESRGRLAGYRQECGELYCRHACGECEPRCPHGVPVNTIMRYWHYFTAQGREREAMEKYTAIPGAKADLCGECEGFCESACPHAVAVQGMLFLAHDRLSLAP